MKLKFFRQIFEKTQISSSIKIRPVKFEFFHADGQADGNYEAYSRFTQFC
jgi:hypothetical protein